MSDDLGGYDGPMVSLSMSMEGDRIVVAITGEMDVHTNAKVRRYFRGLFDNWEGEPFGIVLDLTHIEFMDSTGAGYLVSIIKMHRQAYLDIQGYPPLVIRNPPRRLRRLFEVTKLDRILEYEWTQDPES